MNMWRNCCSTQRTQQRNAEDHSRGPSLSASVMADESQPEITGKLYGLVVKFVKTQNLDCGCAAEVIIPLTSVSWESPGRKHPLQDVVKVSAAEASPDCLACTEFGVWPWRQEVHQCLHSSRAATTCRNVT